VIGNLWLQEALAALEEAQQSADTTAAIQSRVAQQSEVLQQLQSQLEEARQQQVWGDVDRFGASLRHTLFSG
jgi:small-conductance mechanosensitive channel